MKVISGMGQEHIVRSFDQELETINGSVLRMGGMAEAQLANAVDALSRRDPERANRVIASDAGIDELEQSINETAVSLLARRQPMANDLRAIVAALKIASDIERIGDYAKNIAKRVQTLTQIPPVPPAHSVPHMASLAQAIIKEVLDAYVAQDAEKARRAWMRDAEVDEMYTSLFRELLTYMMEDPRAITPCTHLLFVAKNIERIGDHATNIAELIHYQVTGDRMEGGRPKGDDSSFQVVAQPDAPEDPEAGKSAVTEAGE